MKGSDSGRRFGPFSLAYRTGTGSGRGQCAGDRHLRGSPACGKTSKGPFHGIGPGFGGPGDHADGGGDAGRHDPTPDPEFVDPRPDPAVRRVVSAI